MKKQLTRADGSVWSLGTGTEFQNSMSKIAQVQCLITRPQGDLTSASPTNRESDKAAISAQIPRAFDYSNALDGLRGVAIALVLGTHVNPQIFAGGHIGVSVFFTLSGYLITGLLLAEKDRAGGIHLGRFFLRRTLRLLPALLALVAVCLVVTHCWGSPALAADTDVDAAWIAGCLFDQPLESQEFDALR